MGERRPLPPLSQKQARRLRWIIEVWVVVLVAAAIGVATGSGNGLYFTGAAAVINIVAWSYELRRRSDPARTAGWGRPQGYRDRD